jgi:hypothetical protein
LRLSLIPSSKATRRVHKTTRDEHLFLDPRFFVTLAVALPANARPKGLLACKSFLP